MTGYAPLRELLRFEIIQRREEGCEVEGFAERLADIGDDPAALNALYDELMALQVSPSFPYVEPTEWDEIQAERKPGAVQLEEAQHTEEQWRDKFLGAWLGRCAGCALGKPIEAWDFTTGSGGRAGWENVKLWFEEADAWPIQDYTPEFSRAREKYNLQLASYGMRSVRERIQYMETDDDIRYTVLGLLLLERKGRNWSSWDVGKLWHGHLAFAQVCTAETQAYRNFTQVTSHYEWSEPQIWSEQKDWVRTYRNPYREWIGAQIRVDALAYGAAGNPELAAEFAWRDATFSHVKNGVYGAMFVAAMIAAAFVERDPVKLVETGLSVIPARSRLYQDIRQAMKIASSATDQIDLVSRIWDAFKHYDPIHTNNNAALVAASLIFAKGDFEKAITTSVLGGWDTDCNGATVGSIMGASLGASALPEHWTSKLNDTLYAEVTGFHPIKISECASRSYEVFRNINP